VNDAPSPFWTFSLAVYREGAVQRECLELQDRYGVDVNLLLFCAFIGAVRGAAMPDQAVRLAGELVEDWHRDIVASLREVRRALKPLAIDASPVAASAAALRANVKAMELEAERIEQTMLERWSAVHGGAWPRAEPAAAVAGNIRALFAIGERAPRPPDLPTNLVAAALAVAGRSGVR
jgi:uncharacterized protein (TIGR02444 family)